MNPLIAVDAPRPPGVRTTARFFAALLDLLTATDAWAGAIARGIERRRHRLRTERALRELDAHLLHDLGLDASEIGSLARECAGEAQATRVHALLESHAR